MARGRWQGEQKAIHRNRDIWLLALYIRLSREDGNDESESVVNQKKIIEEFIESSFDGPYQIVDYYIDDGLTGTDDTRKDFMRMIQDIELGKVNCIVCKTLARAFRNYSDQGYYLEAYFQQKKVRFITIGDPRIDTYLNPDAVTGLEVLITGIMNDRFASRTSHDVRRTFNSKRKRGEYIGAFAPYGYLKDENNKNRLVIDEEIAVLKREILGWIINEGMTWMGAAKRLNEMGVPNPTAYKRSKGFRYNNPHATNNDGLWCGTTLKRTMLDPVNLGHMVQGKQRVISYKVHDREQVEKSEWFFVENTHPAIFTKEEYDTLVNIAKRDTRAPIDQKVHYLFSGFLRCGDCGKAMRRKASRGYVYYCCRTFCDKSKSRCSSHSMREDTLEKAVLIAIQRQIQYMSELPALIDRVNENPAIDTQSERLEKMLKERKRELEKARSISDSLYADLKTDLITRDDYVRMKTKYDEQIKALTDAVANLEAEQSRMDSALDSSSTMFMQFQNFGNITALDRGILSELVEEVLVFEKGEITIRFRFADELARILEILEKNKQ